MAYLVLVNHIASNMYFVIEVLSCFYLRSLITSKILLVIHENFYMTINQLTEYFLDTKLMNGVKISAETAGVERKVFITSAAILKDVQFANISC